MRFSAVMVAAILAAAAAAAGLGPALASEPSPEQRSALTERTGAYFDAVSSGDGRALDALVTPDFRTIGPRGASRGAAGVVSAATRVNFDGSTPRGSVTIGRVVADGATITEEASSQTYSYAFAGGTSTVVRRYSAHTLTWIAGADGVWRVREDRVTTDNTYY